MTHIIGLSGGPQEVGETADSLLERLDLKAYFVSLTLPDGIPVWVKASAVSFVRAIEPWDHIRAEAKSALNASGRPIFVKEGVTTIKDAINAIRRQIKSQIERARCIMLPRLPITRTAAAAQVGKGQLPSAFFSVTPKI